MMNEESNFMQREIRATQNQNGERSRPGCGSTRPRVELCARRQLEKFVRPPRARANDESVAGCARGGRAPGKIKLE